MLNHHNTRQLGFTLIELIMVLFIIAIMASMVGLSFSGAKSPVREERDRFLLVLREARDYAILHGQYIRIRPNQAGDGYEFAQRKVRFENSPKDSNSYIKPLREPLPKRVVYWDVELGSPIFKSHAVAAGVKLELEGEDGGGTILVSPTGDMRMGKVRISGTDEVYNFIVDKQGKIVARSSEDISKTDDESTTQ